MGVACAQSWQGPFSERSGWGEVKVALLDPGHQTTGWKGGGWDVPTCGLAPTGRPGGASLPWAVLAVLPPYP